MRHSLFLNGRVLPPSPARVLLPMILLCLAACVPPVVEAPPVPTPAPTATEEPPVPTATKPAPPSVRSFETGVYRNLFAEYLGVSEAETDAKINAAWEKLFYGNDDFERVYYPAGEDMAYMADIGNGDVRSEGMSYGMMIAVQLDKKEEFDRLWKWAKTYMYQSDGPYRGYFAWHCTTDGARLHANPASDGEIWFVAALFFASHRWGDGEGIFDYRAEAQAILDTMLYKHEEDNGIATDMFDRETKQVVFVPSGRNSTFTDPSYHMPSYYELWALWAERDNAFWGEAAQASREFFRGAAHPQTGLMPDYANFDGTPVSDSDHKDFRFDAWRTLANVAMDYQWFGADSWQAERSIRVLTFLASEGVKTYGNQYTLDGKMLSGDHSTGLVAMAATAALAADEETGKPFVEEIWSVRVPQGQWRYYDGLLYLIGLLQTGGRFQIYAP